MTESKKSSRPINRQSITYRSNKVEKASSSGLANFDVKDDAAKHSENRKLYGLGAAEPKNRSEILSTTELISAVGQIWDLVNASSISESKLKADCNSAFVDLVAKDVRLAAFKDGGGSCFSVDVGTDSNIEALLQPKLELLSVTQKISMSEPCSKGFAGSLVSRFLKKSTKYSNEAWKEKAVSSLGCSYDIERMYGRMKQIIPLECLYPVSLTKIIEDRKADKICTSGSTISHAEGYLHRDETHASVNVTLGSAGSCCDLFKSKVASLDDDVKVATEAGNVGSLCSDYFLGALHDNNIIGNISMAQTSSLYVDYHIDVLIPHRSPCGTFQHDSDDSSMDQNTIKQPNEFVAENKNSTDVCSSASERPHYCNAKQQHAYAGAFAGIFVSLCLHPVDTIKTVSQSYQVEQKTVCDIGRSIVSDRGIFGLYRGIASNIASSAPISAIYTFTYESVKASLLPLCPKEYHSIAHCIAGGSASIATSFVFTPSERIKQQMQIGSCYRNCWNAFIRIIGNGGLPSLYTGWGAVLCRNVPHSIIKFYTYESLKQLMLPSQTSTAQHNTIQTLVCGGLAGSTAALFTNPFDVVKTRLQTQIPGSKSQYNSVFHALKEIGKNEGLKGLYRGLIPRLVMYVSQGALFFASYEFFKRFFSLDVPQFGSQRILGNEISKDYPT